MAHLMPMELWAMTFAQLDYKDLRRCMLVDKFFQQLTHDPKLRSIHFRGTVISTMISYFQFLISMYFPEDEMCWPPAGGWPETTGEHYLHGVHPRKTDEVLDIVRYLPILGGWDHALDRGNQFYCGITSVMPDGFCPLPAFGILPPGTFCMGQPPGRDGYYLFVDIEQTTVTIQGSNSRFRGKVEFGYKAGMRLAPNKDSIEKAIQEDDTPMHKARGDHWRKEPTYWFPDLFEYFKQQFRDLELVPSGLGENLGGGEEEAAIFRKHGWPSSSYDKIACMAELRAYAADNSSGLESESEE